MGRAGRRALAVVGILAGAAAIYWLLAFEPIVEHRVWYARVQTDVLLLAQKRPPDVPPGQWEFLVGWTLNLHGNCGASSAWVDRRQMWRFVAALERRLKGPTTVATIDWIWDEYAQVSTFGGEYGMHHRPTRSPELELAEPGCFRLWVK